MVMMCDLMVSTENTPFYYPEAKLGTTGGGISSLVTRMPHKLAMEIMLLGSKISGAARLRRRLRQPCRAQRRARDGGARDGGGSCWSRRRW